MEAIYKSEKRLFGTACKIMQYNDYLDSKHHVPFVDIGHFEEREYKSDIGIWLKGHVTMEAEIGELKAYIPFECIEFTSFIVSIIHEAKYIISKGRLDEFTYNSFASSIKCLFDRVIPDNIVSYRNVTFADVDIPITNDKKDLERLGDIIYEPGSLLYPFGNHLQPLVKYTSSDKAVFYILKSGNVVVEGPYIVSFDEFEKIMEMASLLWLYINTEIFNIKDGRSQYLDELINLISEK